MTVALPGLFYYFFFLHLTPVMFVQCGKPEKGP